MIEVQHHKPILVPSHRLFFFSSVFHCRRFAPMLRNVFFHFSSSIPSSKRIVYMCLMYLWLERKEEKNTLRYILFNSNSNRLPLEVCPVLEVCQYFMYTYMFRAAFVVVLIQERCYLLRVVWSRTYVRDVRMERLMCLTVLHCITSSLYRRNIYIYIRYTGATASRKSLEFTFFIHKTKCLVGLCFSSSQSVVSNRCGIFSAPIWANKRTKSNNNKNKKKTTEHRFQIILYL